MKAGSISARLGALCLAAVVASSAALAMAANRNERQSQTGQPGDQPAMTGGAMQPASSPAGQAQLLSSNLLKHKVLDQQGKDLGHISELIIDPKSGQVTHAVISYGQGFMGIGNKEVLVPWKQLQTSQRNGQYQIQADESQLRAAQEFNRSQFEQRTARAQQTQTYRGTVVSVTDQQLQVRTDEGVMTVSTGQDWATKRGQLKLKEGDQVTIQGFSSGFGAQRQIVAQQISANDQTITLETGERPYRETGQEQQKQPQQQKPQQPQPYNGDRM